MNDLLMVIFTGVLTASTIIYTMMSYRQWKATRASVELTRLLGFVNLCTQLEDYLQDKERRGELSAAVRRQLETVIFELGVDHFFTPDLKKNVEAMAYFAKIEGMIRAGGVDPESVWWFKPILRKLR